MNESTKELQSIAGDLGVYDISATVLGDTRFDVWSGSSKPEQHHYGKHGLSIHTLEVVKMCFATIKTLNVDVDHTEVFLSALFHDCGKMYDYEPTDETYENWVGTSHKRQIHHISRSALIWSHASTFLSFSYIKYHDSVLHNILSHHGSRAAGSPVMPYTKAAWLLHLCDGLSARLNDCDKIDFLKLRN